MNFLKKILIIAIALFTLSIFDLAAQKLKKGSVSGTIMDKESQKPLEFANVVLRKNADSTLITGVLSDSEGNFILENIPFGEYKITYSYIGYETGVTPVFRINADHHSVLLGKLLIANETRAVDEVVVKGEKSTYINSIDRKVFNVGKDLISSTGSVSDLLQNVPSVTVDIDGVVSLRGSESVMILINGKPSALMNANRAAVLQQLPANSIEKIEVITNPSAKYKPDGTSGIINIVLKKDKNLGLNGTVTVNAGNNERFNGNFTANYNPGRLNVFASYSFRQDDRLRYIDNARTKIDSATGTKNYYYLNSTEHSRPFSNIISTGADYRINDHNKIGITGSYNSRTFLRNATDVNNWQDSAFNVIKDYDRKRTDPEWQEDMEFGANIQHTFSKEGHELNLDYISSQSREQENNHYTDIYRVPAIASSFDNTLIRPFGKESQLTLEYIYPISSDTKFEAGYIYEYHFHDMDYFGELWNPSVDGWQRDFSKSNRFIYSLSIHVLYATFEKEMGKFGFLAGVRAEQAYSSANQVTTDTILNNQYFKFYPSLHLSYKINDTHELQMNYSHRIRRPDEEELNPFPEYQDPYNLRIGNPYLKPEEIHSVEIGYQFKKKGIQFLSTIYYRNTYNGLSSITRFINDTVLLSTRENLAISNSAGLEMVLTSSIGKFMNLNLSTNTFYNTIDASSLGYSKNRSIISWSANMNAGFNLSKSTMMQFSSNYLSARLTPQGEMLPSFVMNAGFRQEFLNKKLAVIITISDILNSLRNNTLIDTPDLYQKIMRKRSARIIYLGLTYNFGNELKKKKENTINYDNQL
jgi:outer membrane receptor protein involved in Fe transport